MADAERQLEEVLYVVSHDLREPLRAIEGFSRLLRERHAAQLDPRGSLLVERIVAATGRLNHMLEDILRLSRAGRAELASEPVDLEAIVRSELRQREAEIQASGARVSLSPPLPRVRGDAQWIARAVGELLANALKFRSGEKPAEVEVSTFAPLDGEPPAPGLVVADRGPGVDPQQAERLFGLFQRGVGRDVEGTGAGLALARRVAARHGGTAFVRPRPGGGSEFVLTFSAR